MPRVTRERVVRAPPERVFAALTDPRERVQWLASMAETPGDGPLRVGTRVEARRKALGSRSRYEMTVLALEPGRRLETAVRRNGEPVGKGGYELSPVAEGTRVRAWGEFELSGLQKMMTGVVSLGMEKELEADLAALQRHVEARSASG
jgi:uncharacterized protein YndB with AHSA1/START domain